MCNCLKENQALVKKYYEDEAQKTRYALDGDPVMVNGYLGLQTGKSYSADQYEVTLRYVRRDGNTSKVTTKKTVSIAHKFCPHCGEERA